MALGARLELATLWLTARCSTIELPKNMVTRGGIEPTVLAVKERCLSHLTNEPCWRMAQDSNLWSSTNDFSLAKRHNKPLCQPSIWSSEQELNLYLSRRYDCAIVTPSLDILPPYSPCCIFRPPKDCNLDVLCLYTSILIGGRCAIAFPTIHLMLVWSIFCIGC